MFFESTVTRQSRVRPGVWYTIRRMSFGRRTDLLRQLRMMTARMEFNAAGNTVQDKADAAVYASEIDQLYLQWGLGRIEGLEIDGEEASPELLVEHGPEDLCREILEDIRKECVLSQEERKN
jgi:hypothetical protein